MDAGGLAPNLEKSVRRKRAKPVIKQVSSGSLSDFDEKPRRPPVKSSSVPARKQQSIPRNISDLKEADDVKDTFLATVSHELRTPLNGIVGMISMLRDAGPLNQTQNDYLTILMECSHQLMNMMNNMLDFSKMVSNRLALLRGPMSIGKTLQDALVMVEGKAKSKGLIIKLNVQENLPVLVGDSQRLTQILSNLLANAVKFTEHGHISVKIRGQILNESSSGKDDRLTSKESLETLEYLKRWRIDFEVEDTGIGIDAHEQEKIFEVFHQSPTLNTNMSRSGTGLGLSIARELVRMMGGEISVKSEGVSGKGSVFSFWVVTEEEIKTEDLQKEHSSLVKGAKVMVVDDRAEYRIQLTDILFKWGCNPTVVSSGEEALRYISHGIEFDTIIVDICMPYLSGPELAQNIRGGPASSTPLLALSSVELENKADLSLFDVYMNKPIDQNFLFPALLKCLVKKKNEGITPKISAPIGTRVKKERNKLKILIAEDDHNNAYTIREMLKYLGFNMKRIRTVENGKQAVEEAKKHKFDVILMDIVMPIVDGLEATKFIRQLTPRPYIIAVSAAVQNSDKQRCQNVGVDGYLPKPVLKEKLLSVLYPLIIS